MNFWIGSAHVVGVVEGDELSQKLYFISRKGRPRRQPRSAAPPPFHITIFFPRYVEFRASNFSPCSLCLCVNLKINPVNRVNRVLKKFFASWRLRVRLIRAIRGCMFGLVCEPILQTGIHSPQTPESIKQIPPSADFPLFPYCDYSYRNWLLCSLIPCGNHPILCWIQDIST